jgi:hypothetical protein
VIEADPPRRPLHHHYPSRGSSNGSVRGRSSTTRLNLAKGTQQHRPLLLGATSETPLPTRERLWSLLARSRLHRLAARSSSPSHGLGLRHVAIIGERFKRLETRASGSSIDSANPADFTTREALLSFRTSSRRSRIAAWSSSSTMEEAYESMPPAAGPCSDPHHLAVVTQGKRLVQAASLPPTLTPCTGICLNK